MMPQLCEREATLIAALHRGSVPEELCVHASECPACADAELIWRQLRTERDARPPLPSAGLIWWKAQLESRKELAGKSVAAIDWVQKFALVAAMGLLAAARFPWLALAGLAVLACAAAGVLYAWSQERI